MAKAPITRNGVLDFDHIKPPPRKKIRHYKSTELKLGSSGSYPSGPQEKADRPKFSTDAGKAVRDQDGKGDEEGRNQKTSRNQAISAKMEPFTLEILALIQAEIIGLECAGTRANKSCSSCPPPNCDSPSFASTPNTALPSPNVALYRCLDCFHSEETCSDCILIQHRHLPFHRIQKWTGTHFEKTTLATLGYILHLGHEGSPCKMNDENPVECVVVHTNGIHTLPIGFCKCKPKNHSRLVQLVSNRLFPSTVDIPRTMFTFHVLEDFHRHSLSSKSSAYDYYEALKRHNDAAFPRNVPDRYASLLLVMRFWRFLSLCRWAGQEHKIDGVLTHRRPGSVAVWCPACPEIGFNVDEDTLKCAWEGKTHIYTLFISADGNFRLQLKRKNHDPKDRALNNGNAYFVETAAYKEHLKTLQAPTEESTCAKLKAVRQQDRVKFKDAIVSGLVGFQCTRHGQWMSQGMVDLEKGETYSRTDYALAHALGKEALRQRWIMLSYDIWCQYHRNLPKRFKEKFDYLLPTIEAMRGAIPKMHIHGHNFQCQIDHSFYYKKYSGMTCGEGIESSWSEQNHAANSTKEANDGHRHDTLDDFNGYWNWCKLVQLDTFLLHQAKRFHQRYEAVKEAFTNFTPSELKSYAELVEGEADADYGLTGFILEGLELEDRLAELKLTNGIAYGPGSHNDEEDEPDLIDLLQNWRSQQSELFPLLRPAPPNIRGRLV
ncbi:hypothetical protein NP233_g9626 [Leucocoprinus birnbaumii]|uniref:CxC2-like cysteine cluster KDZ transposase-associated domain-containing protein n=1 Tax=Leucocoprinus birnbaumii TaxID=56174 RepID=A0AAD5YSN8_9AGAR|nr:hypothetical protein NP233_g9626 [Leucocoprinus birnbaumii]